MAWMSTLYETYEANAQMAGKPTEGVPLSLVAHMTANAQIEINIDENGEFLGANPVEKERAKTIIPVTESSASRANVIAPHALCDMLPYVAGDFGQYLSDKKVADKAAEKFKKYAAALKGWAESPFTHEKIRAVYAYIAKKQMTCDLIASKILKAENGMLLEEKISGAAYEKALVRFRVSGSQPDAVWQDESLFHCYTRYYASAQDGEQDICYLSGKTDTVSVNHPKGIIASSYGAKLISSNDKVNFTFRGRFSSPEQAYAVSYEATQKAHSALTWLVARQGVTVGTQDKRTYICWNPKGKQAVDLEDPFGLEDDGEPRSYTEEEYKTRLKSTLGGYGNKLENNDGIVVMGLDAATTGRLSVVYYNELKASDFYDRMAYWYETCCWYFTRFTQEKKPYLTARTPLTKQIVLCAFGTERGDFLEVSDKLMKEQYQRVLNCILNKQPLPRDIMHAVVCRASSPQAYSLGNRGRILSTACALIAKYHSDKKGVKINMALDYDTDRSYLFGRLLAVFEKAERVTFKTGETREPNAIQLQSAYVNHPMSTWMILNDKLNPYFQRIESLNLRKKYKGIIEEITEKLRALYPAEQLNRPLEELYLIGYYLQCAELNKSKTKDDNKEEQENGRA